MTMTAISASPVAAASSSPSSSFHPLSNPIRLTTAAAAPFRRVNNLSCTVSIPSMSPALNPPLRSSSFGSPPPASSFLSPYFLYARVCHSAMLLPPPRSSNIVHSPSAAFPKLRTTQGQSALLCRSSSIKEPSVEGTGTDVAGGQGGSPPEGGGEDGGGGGGAMAWASSALIFALWAALIFYCSIYSPNQTPYMDRYFLEKLLFLKGDDGYQMNQVLVCLWNVMGLWPLIYCMLLIPTGRSSKSGVAVWPFTTLSCFVGAAALLPYFGLWRPPPPPVSREEIDRWPLKVLDSKLLSVVVAVAGSILIGTALLSGGDSWKEFLRYFGGSRFIHIMSLDFLAMSSLAPFWVYNDMQVRNWSSKGSWLIAFSLIPCLGPTLYLILRPSLAVDMIKEESGK